MSGASGIPGATDTLPRPGVLGRPTIRRIYSWADALGDSVNGYGFGGIQLPKVAQRLFTILQIVVLAGVLVFIVFLAVSYGSGESALGHDLQSHGLHTVGTVTAAEPSSHDSFSYSYTVDGSQYSGDTASFQSGQTLDASQLHVGQQIPVIYDARDPQQSCSCDVHLLTSTAWSNNLAPLFLLIPGTGVVVVALLARQRKRQRTGE
jgi:hypothetical protein